MKKIFFLLVVVSIWFSETNASGWKTYSNWNAQKYDSAWMESVWHFTEHEKQKDVPLDPWSMGNSGLSLFAFENSGGHINMQTDTFPFGGSAAERFRWQDLGGSGANPYVVVYFVMPFTFNRPDSIRAQTYIPLSWEGEKLAYALYNTNGGYWNSTPLLTLNATAGFVLRQAPVQPNGASTVNALAIALHSGFPPGNNIQFLLYMWSIQVKIGGVWYSILPFAMTGLTPVSGEVPEKFSLSQNFPNPFNPKTTIRFDIPKAGNVKLVVYDITGREVSMIVNEHLNAGKYEVKFDGSNLSSGTYFYRFETEEGITTKKMMLIK